MGFCALKRMCTRVLKTLGFSILFSSVLDLEVNVRVVLVEKHKNRLRNFINIFFLEFKRLIR